MKKRTTLSVFTLIIGLALIITCFLVFYPEDADQRMMYLHIIVSCVIFAAVSFDWFRPLIDLDKDQPKQVGSLGLRWFTTYGYAIFAIILMFVGFYYPLEFRICALIHAIMFFLLVIGIMMAISAGEKVEEVAAEERRKLDGRDSMRRAVNRLVDEASLTTGLPPEVAAQIRDFQDRLRFITPSDTAEASDLEHDVVALADTIRIALPQYSMCEQQISQNLARLNLALENRKKCLSRR